MGIAEDWSDLMWDLSCLSKQVAKRRFRKSIKYGWGGLCCYCRSNRATSLDHVKPKSKGGSSLRSNLLPACKSCNHDKGSRHWLDWFKEQPFYNETAKELIEEWISNKRFIEEELDDRGIDNRTTLRTLQSEVRGSEDEPTSARKDSPEIVEISYGTKEWRTANAS